MSADRDDKGHEEGAQAPFPPVWPGDPHAGHHKSCGVRVKIACTCGYLQWSLKQITKDKALMPLASEFIHGALNLPADVHIVGAKWEPVDDSGNIVLALQAFSSDEFPGPRVTARFTNFRNLKTGNLDVIFEGWESVD